MSINTWIQNNLLGGSRDYTKVPVGPDQEAQDIQKDLGHIQDEVDKLRQPVDVSVEGGYKNLSNRDKVVLGASGGAVVGGALGAIKGLAGASAPFTVDPHFETHNIMQPHVAVDQARLQVPGTTQVATANGLQDVQVPNAAVRYHFEPKVTMEKVGEFKTPGQVSGHTDFTTNSVLGAAEGAALGAVSGVALTAGYILVQHLRGDEAGHAKPAPTTHVDYGDDKKTIAVAGGVGAVVGGAVGALDAALEQSRGGQTQTITWETPVMKSEVIGQVPKDASILIRQDVRYSQDAFKDSQVFNDPSKFKLDDYLKHGPKTDVQGDVAQKHLLGIGGFQMEKHEQVVHAEPRYGVAGTVMGGVVLGGIIGVGAGVAINVIKKIVDPD